MPVVWGAVLVMSPRGDGRPAANRDHSSGDFRPRPVRQLLAFWLGGMVMGLAVGLGVLSFLRDVAWIS